MPALGGLQSPLVYIWITFHFFSVIIYTYYQSADLRVIVTTVTVLMTSVLNDSLVSFYESWCINRDPHKSGPWKTSNWSSKRHIKNVNKGLQLRDTSKILNHASTTHPTRQNSELCLGIHMIAGLRPVLNITIRIQLWRKFMLWLCNTF
jgi:hypothetical protein